MGNKFLSARNEIDELLQEKKEIVEKASNVVSRICIDMNEKGIVDTEIIVSNIKKLINGFTADEQNEILLLAIKKIIINL